MKIEPHTNISLPLAQRTGRLSFAVQTVPETLDAGTSESIPGRTGGNVGEKGLGTQGQSDVPPVGTEWFWFEQMTGDEWARDFDTGGACHSGSWNRFLCDGLLQAIGRLSHRMTREGKDGRPRSALHRCVLPPHSF